MRLRFLTRPLTLALLTASVVSGPASSSRAGTASRPAAAASSATAATASWARHSGSGSAGRPAPPAPLVAPRATSPVTDDAIVFAAASSAGVGLYVRHVATGLNETVLAPGGAFVDVQDPVLSPDGSRVAYARADLGASTASYQIYVVSVTGAGATALHPSSRDQCAPDWRPVPGGSPSGTLSQTVIYTEDCSTTGTPALTTANVRTHAATTLPITRSDSTPVTHTAVGRYSPDGSKIAFVTLVSGIGNISVADAAGTNATVTAVHGTYPTISPDGTLIAFEYQKSDAQGPLSAGGIAVSSITGGGVASLVATRLTTLDASSPSWGADSSEILYSAAPYDARYDEVTGYYDLFSIDRAGSFPAPVSRTSGVDELPARFTRVGAPAAVPPTTFVPIDPLRLLDTRSSSETCPALGPGSVCRLSVAGASPRPGAGTAKAVVLNITGISPSESTYLSVYPSTGSSTPLPQVSNLNLATHRTGAVLVQVRVGTGDEIVIYNRAGTTNLAVDLEGYFVGSASPPGSRFHPTAPTRVVDSRVGQGCTGRLAAGHTCVLDVTAAGPLPSGADPTAVVLNLTGISPTTGTFLTAYPSGSTRPLTSNLNVSTGSVRANLVTVKVGSDGKIVLYNDDGSLDVLVDIAGWYDADPGGAAFYPVRTPLRVLDTRTGTKTYLGSVGPLGAHGVATVLAGGSVTTAYGSIALPAVQAVVASLTGVSATTPTYLTAYPADTSRPTASNLNLRGGDVVPNLAVVRVPSTGQVRVYNDAGSVHVLADVFGYYAS